MANEILLEFKISLCKAFFPGVCGQTPAEDHSRTDGQMLISRQRLRVARSAEGSSGKYNLHPKKRSFEGIVMHT